MFSDTLRHNVQSLRGLKTRMLDTDFLLTWEKSHDELAATVLAAEILKELHRERISTRVFDGGLAISIFRDKSTRTRFSFAMAASMLGLSLAELDEEKSQIAHGETVRETANMISFFTEIIGIRDDMFLGEGNKYMKEVASAVTEGAEKGVLHRRPSLVNLQCDIDHPTQAMADLVHLMDRFGSFDGLRGKKLAMTWAYSPSYGKPLSVPQGIIGLMTRFGMKVTLAHPEGYGLIPEVAEIAAKNAAQSGGSFKKVATMEEAFKGADVVYPKSWAPYGVMQRRTKLLKEGNKPGLVELEKECLANNAKYRSWECNEEKMKLTKKGEALYMHCLPADISGVSCAQGEVSKGVFEKYRIETYREAGNKPFVIAAMMLLSRFVDPVTAIERLGKSSK
ncbi:MAG: knotted carbamoyltransferase YgeW [Planctomycetota bacterium]|nr:knotted carbamoyltransferase YgeW [Planctomycetota bacterium]